MELGSEIMKRSISVPELYKAFHKAITGNLSKPSSIATSLELVLGSFSYLNDFSSLKLRT